MHEKLIAYMGQYATLPLTSEEQALIVATFQPKKLRKKQYFLQEGEICQYYAFILKGAMRKYYVDEKGTEHIVNLYIENWWAGDMESFTMLSPSIYNIDAWEDSEVLLITHENSLKLTNQSPAFNKMLLKLDEKHKIATEKRITSAISFTAEKRYANFIDCHSDFLQRFPQHIIASYLGITKETLSRVRNQFSQK